MTKLLKINRRIWKRLLFSFEKGLTQIFYQKSIIVMLRNVEIAEKIIFEKKAIPKTKFCEETTILEKKIFFFEKTAIQEDKIVSKKGQF